MVRIQCLHSKIIKYHWNEKNAHVLFESFYSVFRWKRANFQRKICYISILYATNNLWFSIVIELQFSFSSLLMFLWIDCTITKTERKSIARLQAVEFNIRIVSSKFQWIIYVLLLFRFHLFSFSEAFAIELSNVHVCRIIQLNRFSLLQI